VDEALPILHALVSQIAGSDYRDGHGHEITMLKPYAEAVQLLEQKGLDPDETPADPLLS
jgi:hypothetical protein